MASKKISWSQEQLKAINLEGMNILVSAGAGSGKTEVLKERIIRKLINKVKIKDLIVVTFTVAAASEMKERIRKSLIEEIKDGKKFLEDELIYLDQAHIETFDAFSLGLVKKYHYLLGIPKNIAIIDESFFKIKENEYINDIFNVLYQKKDATFLEMVKMFSLKDDDELKSIVINLYHKISLVNSKLDFFDNYSNDYLSSEFLLEKTNEFMRIIKDNVETIKFIIDDIYRIVSDKKIIEHIAKIQKSLEAIFSKNTYEEIREALNLVSFPRFPSKVEDEAVDEVKEKIENIKKIKTHLTSLMKASDLKTYQEEVLSTQKYVLKLIEMIKELDFKMSVYKHDNNSYQFIDISQMALKLLKENDEVRNYIKDNTNEILVDEYQDTSDLQEELLDQIAKNNLYMVGDIKQSIYRFRNANPDIFKNRYFNNLNNNEGVNIDLYNNYRSRKEVISSINYIFDRLMDIDLGGADYQNSHRLIYGNKNYDFNKQENNNLEVYVYEKTEDIKVSKSEIEASIIACDIRKKIDNYLVFDKESKQLRKAKYNDFAILTLTKSAYDVYKSVFEYYKIPLNIYSDEGFIKNKEIIAIKSILKCLYCLEDSNYFKENFRFALASLLRSFLVDKDEEKIFLVLQNKDKDELLKALNFNFNGVYENLIKLSGISIDASLGEIIEEIYRLFAVYKKISYLPNASAIEDRLSFLLEKACSLSCLGYGVFEFINYLDKIEELDMDVEFNVKISTKEEAVNLLSIHKSKGLEYPICYFPSLDTNFNTTEIEEKVFFEKRVGIVFPSFANGLHETILKDITKHNYQIDEVSEKLRLLYVAFTRAKEKAILITKEFKHENKCDNIVAPYERLRAKSFYDFLELISENLKSFRVNIPLDFLPTFSYYKENLDSINSEKINTFSVSLKGKDLHQKVASFSDNKIIDSKTAKTTDFGSRVHLIFSTIDFSGDLEKQIALIKDPWVKEKVTNFVSLPLFKEEKIVNSFSEYNYSYRQENVLKKGIIDLLIEAVDKYIIIDYKLSNINKEEYVMQIGEYKKYVEMISKKDVDTYLYSINENVLLKIDV